MVYTIGRETVDAWDRERLRHSGVTHAKASHDCIMSPSDSPVPWDFWAKGQLRLRVRVCVGTVPRAARPAQGLCWYGVRTDVSMCLYFMA